MGAADPGATRPDARKIVTDPAAPAHRLGGLGQSGVNAGMSVFQVRNGVADRLHETVDQGGGQIGACR